MRNCNDWTPRRLARIFEPTIDHHPPALPTYAPPPSHGPPLPAGLRPYARIGPAAGAAGVSVLLQPAIVRGAVSVSLGASGAIFGLFMGERRGWGAIHRGNEGYAIRCFVGQQEATWKLRGAAALLASRRISCFLRVSACLRRFCSLQALAAISRPCLRPPQLQVNAQVNARKHSLSNVSLLRPPRY
jgi:hypothetical protein